MDIKPSMVINQFIKILNLGMKYFFSTVILLISFASYAQQPEYYIYLVKGNVTVNKATTKAVKVKQSQLIYKDDIITIGPNSEVSLANKKSEFIVLNASGTYKAIDLSKKTPSPANGVTKKYISLMWQEMIGASHDLSKFKKENVSNVHGGVSRGESCNLLLFPVNGLKTSGDSIYFKWKKINSEASYNLSITDGEGNDVAMIPVRDTQQVVSMLKISNGKPGKFYWMVKPKNINCDDDMPFYFDLLSKDSVEKLIATLNIKNDPEDMESQLQTIEAYEKYGLIHSAINIYSELVKKHKENKPLYKSYIAFLLQYGYEVEAIAAWKNITTTANK